jgi:type I restriction enzyme S subunit
VLKSAVEGNLTKEWRTANQGKLEPASILLERILKQRREKWETEQLAKMEAQGKTPKDDSWKLKYKEPIAPDTSDLPELPDGWCWASLEQLSDEIVDCLHSTPKFTPEGKYCIDTNCIEPGKILFNKSRFVSEETYKERIQRLVPQQGDILFAREGTIGTAVVVPENTELCLGQRMMQFRPSACIKSVYFMLAMLSNVFYTQWKDYVTGTTSPHVNIRDLRKMSLPLPSLVEQKEILEKIDVILSVIDQLEKTIDANLKRSEKLRQSILKQAFEGKLVPQDPNDEPAEKLLERIKAEKAKQTTTKTPRKTKSKKKSDLQLELPLK